MKNRPKTPSIFNRISAGFYMLGVGTITVALLYACLVIVTIIGLSLVGWWEQRGSISPLPITEEAPDYVRKYYEQIKASQAIELWQDGCLMSPDSKLCLKTKNPDYTYQLVFKESSTTLDLFTLSEADPGSGRSWDIQWSPDSNAIRFWGTISTEKRDDHGFLIREPIDYIYIVKEGKLFALPSQDQ